jgi:hypothetical protein
VRQLRPRMLPRVISPEDWGPSLSGVFWGILINLRIFHLLIVYIVHWDFKFFGFGVFFLTPVFG